MLIRIKFIHLFLNIILKKFVKRNMNIQCTRLKDCHDEKCSIMCKKQSISEKLCEGIMFEPNWSIAGYTKSLIPSFIYIYLFHTRPGIWLFKRVSCQSEYTRSYITWSISFNINWGKFIYHRDQFWNINNKKFMYYVYCNRICKKCVW